MIFSSMVFIWSFLPVVFLINLFLKTKWSNIFLLIVSIFFYAWGEPFYVLLMLASILVNFFSAKAIVRFPKIKKVFLVVALIFDLSTLGYYKYAGMLCAFINRLLGAELIPYFNVSLPIGISFFTFQAISYVVDVYRGEENKPSFLKTALYISYFPQLIAGPILKYGDICQQIDERKVTMDKIVFGFRRFIYGLSKKVLIANSLGYCVDLIYRGGVENVSSPLAWIFVLFYALQIYYDFSGYSDMAIGLGSMFGFEIGENFDLPYTSKSITEFWRRWHISLGAWFREYVYIPLGGNRKGKYRTCFNLMVVFFFTGLWHGAGLNFIVWGIYYGVFMVTERLFLKKFLDQHPILGWIYCIFLVLIGWVFFRVGSFREALLYIARMLMPWKYLNAIDEIGLVVDPKAIEMAIVAVLGAGVIQKFTPKKWRELWNGSLLECVWCILLLVLAIIAISSGSYNPFIYFQF